MPPPLSRSRSDATLAKRRAAAQQLARPTMQSAHEVVAWLGAVQAQDYNGARWALGVRLGGTDVSEAAIERALDQGRIIRTHALRFTWQFVAPEDLRWMLALVGPRLMARYASRHRELELDAPTLSRSRRLFEKALRGGQHLTRADLARALQDGGVSPAGERLSHLLGAAELDGVLCSGARRGKQFTYALLDQRVPETRTLDREAALTELALRYFRSRGPATLEDFCWWSGMTKTEARSGIAGAGSALEQETVGGVSFVQGAGASNDRPTQRAQLLPPFDEFLVGYRDRSAMLRPEHSKSINAGGGMLGACLLFDGQVVGTWRRVLSRANVEIELSTFDRPAPPVRRALLAAANRYAAFLGLPASTALTNP